MDIEEQIDVPDFETAVEECPDEYIFEDERESGTHVVAELEERDMIVHYLDGEPIVASISRGAERYCWLSSADRRDDPARHMMNDILPRAYVWIEDTEYGWELVADTGGRQEFEDGMVVVT